MAENTATVLLVDDTEASRYAVGRMLRRANYGVIEAGSGAEALRLAQQRPDLIILDVNLPDVSGFEVCQRIKADPATAGIPVLHLSASFVHSDSRSEGLESGADGYLTYPLEPRELIANVEALLRVRRAEREARAQRELLRVTLSSIGDGVVTTDGGGVVTFVNPVAAGLLGWGTDVVGRPIADVFHIVNEETGEPADCPVSSVIRTGAAAGLANHTILVARDGTRRPIDDSAAPILDGEGRFVCVVLVFRDVTERRRLEAEVRQRADDLAERDRRKDEFLAMLAHELRNPLAPISNSLNYLRQRFAGESDFEWPGAVMQRQLNHLARLVEDLMDVSRITRGKFDLRKERVDLATAVTRAAADAKAILDDRKHRLEVTLPADPLCLEADPARIEQVLTNLLSNAAKYTPPGGVVRLTAAREGTDAVVRVRDDGIGIRPEMLPRLFEMFQQADRVAGRLSEGLGLGLTLVRSLTEMHGGTVTASSDGPGRGSEFVVRLPALPAGASARAAPTPYASRSRPLRILVTDDNVDSAASMAMLLTLGGHDTRTAHDGAAALELALEFRPDVAFLDIGLPKGMDGYELARRLRAEAGTSEAMLVAMTGYGQPDDVARSHQAGFDHHLTKPAAPAAVQALLAEFARRGQ